MWSFEEFIRNSARLLSSKKEQKRKQPKRKQPKRKQPKRLEQKENQPPGYQLRNHRNNNGPKKPTKRLLRPRNAWRVSEYMDIFYIYRILFHSNKQTTTHTHTRQ